MLSSVDSDSSKASSASGSCEDAEELRLGMLAYCRFAACGIVQASQIRIVEVGIQQVIVAAPALCSMADLQIKATVSSEQAKYSCACTESGVMCDIVFYSIDIEAVSMLPLPDSVVFRTSMGDLCAPKTRQIIELYYGAADESAPRMQTVIEGFNLNTHYDEVKLGQRSAPFIHNSALLIPHLLTNAECHVLIQAADKYIADAGYLEDKGNPGLVRLHIGGLESAAQELSSVILRDRVLPFFEQHLPEVAYRLFGRSSLLQEQSFSFSPNEPAVNVYTVGGEFKIHTDCFAVTINILLSEPVSFSGGGTAFWPQKTICHGAHEAVLPRSIDDAVVLQPHQGAGVVFNGDVQHSGRPVRSGIRHLYVASFNLV